MASVDALALANGLGVAHALMGDVEQATAPGLDGRPVRSGYSARLAPA
jgi:hypothetical protein